MFLPSRHGTCWAVRGSDVLLPAVSVGAGVVQGCRMQGGQTYRRRWDLAEEGLKAN